MDKNLIIVKIRQDTMKNAIKFLDESLSKNEKRYYSVNETDAEIAEKYHDLKSKIVFVIYKPNLEKKEDEVLCLYIGDGEIKRNEVRWIIDYQVKIKKASDLIVKNFISNSELDLINDFGSHSYISVESSSELIEQLSFIVDKPYEITPKPICDQRYPFIESEKQLSQYSQLNQHCIRPVGTLDIQQNRSEFQRDYERIIHAKAFRRLVDKAQIFTPAKGDYYRTRMTHTLEVAQIARAIATGLNLNIILAEAIALAHDLGHTPFGHQGERTLDDILKNKIEIINNTSKSKNPFGGFKHNFQGLRVVNYLEEKYIDFEGLDVSYQVLEGILKHTNAKIKNCDACSDVDQCMSNCFELKEFFPNGNIDYLYPDYPNATTLEGQIVAIADEIAQRGHDLDDAFSSKILSCDKFSDYLNLNKMTTLKAEISKIEEEIKSALDKNRAFIDIDELQHSRIVSSIIGYFIKDVINCSKDNIANFKEDDFYKENHRFRNVLISFSKEGKILCDYLEKIISKKVINSSEVSIFDNKSSKVVKGLFSAYYNNPRLLHTGTLRRLYIEMRKVGDEIIDFSDGDNKLVKEEFEKIIKAEAIEDENNCTPEQKKYWEKKKVLVRNIVDYISGMTDSYALNEYNKIYL